MLNETVRDLLNQQVNKEFYSAYLYLDFSNYFESKGLDGFANWYKVQAQEERDHAMLFYQYLHNNSASVTLDAIAKPDVALESDMGVLKAGLEHELYVTGLINNIYAAAYQVKDFRTMQFLDWFVKEQGEEETNANDLISKMELFGSDPKSLYLLNSELAARVYTATSLVLLKMLKTKKSRAPVRGAALFPVAYFSSLALHLARNFSFPIMARVWAPAPMGPFSSQAFTAKSTILPFSETAVISASAQTVMPTGVGASWEMSRWVPTLPLPSSRKLWRQVMAAFSIRALIKGVPNTGRAPEPTAEAVSASVTVSCSWHFAPIRIMRIFLSDQFRRRTSDGSTRCHTGPRSPEAGRRSSRTGP